MRAFVLTVWYLLSVVSAQTIFGSLGFNRSIAKLRLRWPPLKTVTLTDKIHKSPRSIFVADVLHSENNTSIPWLGKVVLRSSMCRCWVAPTTAASPPQDQAVLKICPLLALPIYVCENEAWAHVRVSRVTRCPVGMRCACAPHFVGIFEAWKAPPLSIGDFNMPFAEAERIDTYR